VTIQRFSYFLFIVSLVGSVITALHASEAYQLSVSTPSQETIVGRIRNIDRATGRITVETDTGVVMVAAAPEAISGWKEGDPVVVQIDSTKQHEQGTVAEEGTTLPQSSPTAKSDAVLSPSPNLNP
jgi:hypothetical protein